MQVSFRVDREFEFLVLPSLPHLPVYLRDEQDLTGIRAAAHRTAHATLKLHVIHIRIEL
jgi:hypothetical protein